MELSFATFDFRIFVSFMAKRKIIKIKKTIIIEEKL